MIPLDVACSWNIHQKVPESSGKPWVMGNLVEGADFTAMSPLEKVDLAEKGRG